MSPSASAFGFHRVQPTPAELEDWQAHHPRQRPGVYRVQCIACGARIWGSGLGIGAHRRACPSRKVAS